MFANVFNYDLITKTSERDFQETFNNTKATNEEIDSSFMLTRLTFACLKIGITCSLPILIVITYILAFFRTSTVNSANVFLIISTIYEITELALLLFGKWKFKSQFRECFIRETPSFGYQTTFICITSGAIAFETFGGIAGLMTAMKTGIFSCFLLFLNKILQISVIVIQSELILYAKTTSFQSRPVQNKYFRTHHIFLTLLVMNISKWSVDTIITGQENDALFIQRQFYGEKYWDIIKCTIFPVNIFYRFLTSIEMYGLNRHTDI